MGAHNNMSALALRSGCGYGYPYGGYGAGYYGGYGAGYAGYGAGYGSYGAGYYGAAASRYGYGYPYASTAGSYYGAGYGGYGAAYGLWIRCWLWRWLSICCRWSHIRLRLPIWHCCLQQVLLNVVLSCPSRLNRHHFQCQLHPQNVNKCKEECKFLKWQIQKESVSQ